MSSQTINEIREWGMFILEGLILLVVWMEYKYDARKDEAKKQRKTRTTKKTTEPSGMIVKESTETSEPIQEDKK